MKLIRFNGLIFCYKVEDIHMGLFDFFKRNNKVTKDSDYNISNLICDEITTHGKINENIKRENIVNGIEKEGYSVEQNRYIRVKNKNKVYSKGTYVIEVDIQPGEYYFWGENVSAEIKGKEKYDIYGGFDECVDAYANVEGNGSVILKDGYMTHVDNIIYLYDISDKIVPGHVYRVGVEIPHGKYCLRYERKYDDGKQIDFLESGECAFDMRECCDYGRIFRERGKEGLAITDELVKYVILRKGSAILQEQGIFPTNSGPKAFNKRMEDYAIASKIDAFRKKKLQENSKIYKGNYVCFYLSIVDPMVEILLQNILLRREKCNIIPNLSEEDFARNYVVMIDKEDKEKQCVMMYLFLERKVCAPISFGIPISSLIYSMQYNNLQGENYQKSIETIKGNISEDLLDVLKYYSKIYPFQVLDSPYYYVKYLQTDDEYRYLYYKVREHKDEYSKKYNGILLQLAEQGIISKRWRNEFSLYLMVKSYYSDAIYQYHDKFLDKQSLDIYIPSIKLGLEYQGVQHYESIDFFGGDEGFEERKKLDSLKRKKCLENGILLVEWHYTKDITDDNFIQMLKDNGLVVPKKKAVEQKSLRKNDIRDSSTGNTEVIFQYDKDGSFLNEFNSIDEAVEKTGINKVNIQRACSGFRATAGGYQWRKMYIGTLHVNIDSVIMNKSKGVKRAINKYDLTGNFIEQYESITIASKENAINPKSIRDAANKKQRHAGGYVWKYVDEEQ